MPKLKGGKLSAKQRLFVEEYLVDLNATEAALRAGYSKKSAKQIGTENLAKPAVAAEIEKALKKRVERIEVSQDAVIQELAGIAFANIFDVAQWDGQSVNVFDSGSLPKSVLSAVSQVSATAHGVTLRMHDKHAALVTIGKHLGMFAEKVNFEIRDGADIVDRLFGRLDEYAAREEP